MLLRVARATSVGPSSWRYFSAQPIRQEEQKVEEKTTTTKAKSTQSSLPPSSLPPSPSSNREENDLPVIFSDISRAKVAIRGGVKRTPCVQSFYLSEILGCNIYLKPEFSQFTGSFKERGARNAILKLMREQGSTLKGVIAASAGNHALALAYHGKELGIPVTVVMPVVAPLAKVDKCRKFGARVIIEGAHIGESKTFAETLVDKESLTYVNGYDDPSVISGAGTIGCEIMEDVPEVDVVVVPVGGAGLIAGVACAVKTLKPECKVSCTVVE
jgi:threonine dehydratase